MTYPTSYCLRDPLMGSRNVRMYMYEMRVGMSTLTDFTVGNIHDKKVSRQHSISV
jgi:hypothetical protein